MLEGKSINEYFEQNGVIYKTKKDNNNDNNNIKNPLRGKPFNILGAIALSAASAGAGWGGRRLRGVPGGRIK